MCVCSGTSYTRRTRPHAYDPRVPRYVYRVVVGGERDKELLVREEPVQLEDQVPFRGRSAIVERIEDNKERDVWGGDVSERLEADPATQIVRTLICRESVVDGTMP